MSKKAASKYIMSCGKHAGVSVDISNGMSVSVSADLSVSLRTDISAIVS